jgi:hypothetical protein
VDFRGGDRVGGEGDCVDANGRSSIEAPTLRPPWLGARRFDNSPQRLIVDLDTNGHVEIIGSPYCWRYAACSLKGARDYVALELRVQHNGRFYLTVMHQDRVAFLRRVDELRGMLEAHGWNTETRHPAPSAGQ